MYGCYNDGMRSSLVEDGKLVPVIESDLFAAKPGLDLAILNLGYGLDSGSVDWNVLEAYGRLRKNVYVDQMKYLPAESGRNGMEFDEDDERSQHFVVLQQMRSAGRVAVIACQRVIHRGGSALPIEMFFPGVLGEVPSERSAEISRFISRGPRDQRGEVTKKLFDTVLAHTDHNRLDPVVATIEPVLRRLIALAGAPNEVIAEGRSLEAYGNTVNQGIRIQTERMKERVGAFALKGMRLDGGEALFWSRSRDSESLYDGEVTA